MWRGEVRRGRAGQAFDFGEPGVLDGATAKSLAAGRHGPRQVGQIVKTKPLRRSCWRILDQSLEPREPALQATGRSSNPVRSPGFLKGGLGHPLPQVGGLSQGGRATGAPRQNGDSCRGIPEVGRGIKIEQH